MTSPTTDRRFGLVGNTAMKAPVSVLAASNITLSGQQTIDGVAVLATNSAGVPDRVLCTSQTNSVDNGIWDVGTGTWSRSKDADGNYDFAQGTTVLVNRGTTYAGSYWKISNTGAITIGTTAITWTQALASSISTLSFLQAGSGAVSRGAQDKMREGVSVFDFMTAAQIADVQAGTLTLDVTTPVKAAIAAGSHIFFPAGTYKLTETLNIRKVVTLRGETSSGAAASYPSFLSFAPGIVGIFLHRSDTTADSTGHTPSIIASSGTGADGSIIENLAIVRQTGGNTTADGISHGIWLKCRAHVRDCVVSGFAGNGLHVVAVAGDLDAKYRGNANLFTISRVSTTHNYHGLFVDGADANAGLVDIIDASLNQAWGVYDSSFLGNSYLQPHTSANGLGPYFTDNANAHSLFLDPYMESGQNPSEINSRSTVINGLDTGYTAASLGQKSGNSYSTIDSDQTKISRITVTAAGTGYTNATATVAAPTQTLATATATVTGGLVTFATLTNVGAGYSSTPSVTITGGGGTGATATAHLHPNGFLTGITITGLGSGYTSAPTVTIGTPGVGSTATATCVLSGTTVSSVVLTGLGSNYGSDPTVTITGDGTGATATATRFPGTQNVNTGVGFVNEWNATFGDTIIAWSSNAAAGGAGQGFRFAMHRASLDITMAYGGSVLGYQITGPLTTEKFARSTAQVDGLVVPQGIWLGGAIGSASARNVNVGGTIPPVAGVFARGDVVFAISPTAGASPGVVCTTGGTAGSTAVFKAMANVAA